MFSGEECCTEAMPLHFILCHFQRWDKSFPHCACVTSHRLTSIPFPFISAFVCFGGFSSPWYPYPAALPTLSHVSSPKRKVGCSLLSLLSWGAWLSPCPAQSKLKSPSDAVSQANALRLLDLFVFPLLHLIHENCRISQQSFQAQ